MAMSRELKSRIIAQFPNGRVYEGEIEANCRLALWREARAQGIETADFVKNEGFQWIRIERDMDYSGEYAGPGASVCETVNSIYATQPLLGDVILPQETQEELFQVSRKIFDKAVKADATLSLQEKKIWLLETIYLIQRGEFSAQHELWRYLFREYSGYTITTEDASYQKYHTVFTKVIKDVLTQTKHLLIPHERNGITYKQYYDTLLIHAQIPKDALYSFFRILFKFYVEGLDCQYVPNDTRTYRRLVNSICSRWNENIASDMDLNVVAQSPCIRVLFSCYLNYARVYCENIIRKIDVITGDAQVDEVLHLETSYLDRMLFEWYQGQSKTERAEARSKRVSSRNDKIATDAKAIHAIYELVDGKNACITLPKIRFDEITCKRIEEEHLLSVVTVTCDDAVLAQESLKLYCSQGIYTSRVYQYMLESVPVNTLNYRVMVGIGDEQNTIYDSRKDENRESLFRSFLMFAPTGNEIQKIQRADSGRLMLFAPTNSTVDFDENATGVRQIPCVFAQQFIIDVTQIHSLTVAGTDLYVDDTVKSRFRVKTVPGKIDNACILAGDDVFDIYSELETVQLLFPDGAHPEQYQLVCDDAVIPAIRYYKDACAQIPASKQEGLHVIKAIEVGSGTIACAVRYALLPDFSCTLDQDLYSDEIKTVTATISFGEHEVQKYAVTSGPGTLHILLPNFPYGDFLQIDLPVLRGSFMGNNMFDFRGEQIWYENIPMGAHVDISCPKNWMPQLWVGNQMISPAKNTTSFDVGNFLRSYKPDEVHDSQTPSLILRLDGRHSHPVVYEICKIVCRPVILRNPLSFADGVLRWNIEGNFIGKSTSKFRLDLEIGEETYSCELPNEDKELNGVIDLPDGIYPYRLLLVEHSLFACAKSTQLYVDSIIVGDPNSFKFKNTYIFLKAASCWDLKNDTYLQLSLRPEHTRICDIEYTGMSMPTWGEDGLCPSYRGTLQFWNAKWNSWTNFNFDANRERFEHINPIQFWIISDHFLAIYAANEGPLYVDKRYGSILNKAYECLTKTEQLQIEIPDKFEFETRKIK